MGYKDKEIAAAKAKEYRLQNKERYNSYNRAYREKYNSDVDGYASKMLSSAKSRAKKKGLEFDLDVEWIRERLRPLICEATGFTLHVGSSKDFRTEPLQPTLDKRDPKLGYTKANTRIVCWWYNAMKQDWTDEIVHGLIIEYNKHKL